MTVSIIICTRNRAKDLVKTLQWFNDGLVSGKFATEVVVVDNASKDDTAAAVRAARIHGMSLRYVYEPRPGKCNAYNAGMAAARGEVLLFTDDDVRPAPDWVEQLAAPVIRRECDAVTGQIRLADYLERSWMTPMHRFWLAVPFPGSNGDLELTGANMGFHRYVLERVPAFDPELGPGALGFGDESLFSLQLRVAGYRLRQIPEALVVHHLDPARLSRSHWLTDARKRGASQSYLLHHWHHVALKNPWARAHYLAGKLRLRRMLQRPDPMEAENCAAWEISYLANLEMFRHFLKERERPRNYARQGLVKIGGLLPGAIEKLQERGREAAPAPAAT
ncbi:MAG: glycosyltransferase family 2 protein [Verrucomicrobiota bacterium]|jgi:glycosyltransferase involved in cell wall biosynthesis